MSNVVNIIVTCTKQKTVPAPDFLSLRNLQENDIRKRAKSWARQVTRSAVATTLAKDLYAGDHWAIARDLPRLSTPSREYQLWVISAGYGLIPLTEQIKPYSATFSNPHPDSVVRKDSDSPAQDKLVWWTAITSVNWKRSTPQSLAELASRYPRSAMIIAASANYLHAVQDDLRVAATHLSDKELLTIISAGSDEITGLTEHLVPADARLQHLVSGVRRSLNVRLLRYTLEQNRRGRLSYSRIRRQFQQNLNQAPELEKFDRQPLTDVEVVDFIHQSILEEPDICHTPLLRKLRASGKACEQKRFRSLFAQTYEAIYG